MRKLHFFLPLILSALAGFSCKSDEARNTEELIDPWLRERTPVSLRLESQVGAANITNNWRNDGVGDIKITLVTGALDLAKVKVESLELKYGATASVQAGSTINLSSGSTSIVVTSTNGEKRTYNLTYERFVEALEGKYQMHAMKGLETTYGLNAVICEGGVPGNAIWLSLNDKNWVWQGGTGNVNKTNDDIITFVLTGVNSTTGETSGTCTHEPGPDGGYCDFVWSSGSRDLSYMYQLIPNGSSKWKKTTSGLITFYDNSDNVLGTCYRVGPNFSFTADHSDARKFTYSGYAFHRPIEKSGWWNGPEDYYGNESRYINNCRRVLWVVDKVE